VDLAVTFFLYFLSLSSLIVFLSGLCSYSPFGIENTGLDGNRLELGDLVVVVVIVNSDDYAYLLPMLV
jgi:hypothetical protein